jgi:zinc-ribbon domain
VRYCPNCGTEVDDTAAFCPTCGQAIDQAAETAMPAAPAWPAPAAPPTPHEPAAAPAQTWEPADPARTEARPQTPPPPPPPAPAAPARPSVSVPLTMPVTLSGWLIGVGAVIGGLGVVVGLFDGVLNPVELLLLLGLIGIAVATFFPSVLASFPNLRLATLVVALIGFGLSLDRLGFGGAGVGELLLFLGTAATAMGAIILELGRDQPLGPAR